MTQLSSPCHPPHQRRTKDHVAPMARHMTSPTASTPPAQRHPDRSGSAVRDAYRQQEHAHRRPAAGVSLRAVLRVIGEMGYRELAAISGRGTELAAEQLQASHVRHGSTTRARQDMHLALPTLELAIVHRALLDELK